MRGEGIPISREDDRRTTRKFETETVWQNNDRKMVFYFRGVISKHRSTRVAMLVLDPTNRL